MENPVEATYLKIPQPGVNGWHKFSFNADVSDSYEIITYAQAGTYAQIAAEDTIEVLSANGGDTTQKLTLFGIDNKGNQVSEQVSLNGATVVETSTTWRYYECCLLDVDCAGAITIRRATGNTYISGVSIGHLTDYTCQHFNGEKTSYITFFDANLLDNAEDAIIVDLRWYPDDADCLDAADGFLILDRIVLHAAVIATEAPRTKPKCYPQGIRCPRGGWIVPYGLGGSGEGTQGCYVTLQGFDI